MFFGVARVVYTGIFFGNFAFSPLNTTKHNIIWKLNKPKQ